MSSSFVRVKGLKSSRSAWEVWHLLSEGGGRVPPPPGVSVMFYCCLSSVCYLTVTQPPPCSASLFISGLPQCLFTFFFFKFCLGLSGFIIFFRRDCLHRMIGDAKAPPGVVCIKGADNVVMMMMKVRVNTTLVFGWSCWVIWSMCACVSVWGCSSDSELKDFSFFFLNYWLYSVEVRGCEEEDFFTIKLLNVFVDASEFFSRCFDKAVL